MNPEPQTSLSKFAPAVLALLIVALVACVFRVAGCEEHRHDCNERALRLSGRLGF